MSGSVRGPGTGGIDRTAEVEQPDERATTPAASIAEAAASVDAVLGLRPRSSGFGGSLLADQLKKLGSVAAGASAATADDKKVRSGAGSPARGLGDLTKMPPGVSAFVGGARPKVADPTFIDVAREELERRTEGDREMQPPKTLRWEPHPAPEDIRFTAKLPLNKTWNEPPLDAAIDSKGRLDLNKVTPEMLSKLDATDLKTFMRLLSEYRDEEAFGGLVPSPVGTNTDYPDPASALAAKMMKVGDAELAARLFAAAPDKILPYATGKTLRMLVNEQFGDVLREISASNTLGDKSGADLEAGELKALGNVIKEYLGREVGDDPARAAEAVQKILEDVAKSGVPMTPQTMGVLMGSLLGGLQKHFDAMKMSAEERKSFMNKVFDGAEKVLGKIPGPWGQVLPLVTKGLKALYNSMTNPSDQKELRLALQATLRLQLLDKKSAPEGWTEQDAGRALDFLEAALNANGIDA